MSLFKEIHTSELTKITLPDWSRVWIYQADRKISFEEEKEILAQGINFAEQWNAHGTKLSSGVFVLHHLFVIVVADEQVAGASGCSIDKSVHFIQRIGDQFKIDFFNRLNLISIHQDEIQIMHISDLEQALINNRIYQSDLIFNPIVPDIQSLKNNWLIPLKDSWAKNRIPTVLNS